MYDTTIPEEVIPHWKTLTDKAIQKGIGTGDLLSEVEQQALAASPTIKALSRGGSALHRMESDIGESLLNLLSKGKKYLPKLL